MCYHNNLFSAHNNYTNSLTIPENAEKMQLQSQIETIIDSDTKAGLQLYNIIYTEPTAVCDSNRDQHKAGIIVKWITF